MRVLIAEAENFSSKALAKIQMIFPDTTIQSLTQNKFAEEIKDYNIVFIRLRLSVTKEMMHNDLKYIISPTTGTDHIDMKSAEKKGIRVLTLFGEDEFLKENITSSAEFSLALMLMTVKKMAHAVNFPKINTFPFRGLQLKDKTIGIIGYGRNGQFMDKYCTALGMKVLKYDPYCSFANDDLVTVLKQSDVVSIHVPLNEETRGMINAERIRMMKRGSYIINTARGEIVDEEEVFNAVNIAYLAGYATDVISKKCSHLIGKNMNFIVTPHIAGASSEAVTLTDNFLIDKLIKEIKE